MSVRPQSVPKEAEEQDDGSWVLLDILDFDNAIRREAWAPDGTRLFFEHLDADTRKRRRICLFFPNGQADLDFEDGLGEAMRADTSITLLAPTLPEFPDHPNIVRCTFEMLSADPASLAYQIGNVAFQDDSHRYIGRDGSEIDEPEWLAARDEDEFSDTQETDVEPADLVLPQAALEERAEPVALDDTSPTDVAPEVVTPPSLDDLEGAPVASKPAPPSLDDLEAAPAVRKPPPSLDDLEGAPAAKATPPAATAIIDELEHFPSLEELGATADPPSLADLEEFTGKLDTGPITDAVTNVVMESLDSAMTNVAALEVPPVDPVEAAETNIAAFEDPLAGTPELVTEEPEDDVPMLEVDVEPLSDLEDDVDELPELSVEPMEPLEPAPTPPDGDFEGGSTGQFVVGASLPIDPDTGEPRDGRYISTHAGEGLHVEAFYEAGIIGSFSKTDAKKRVEFRRTRKENHDMLVLYGPNSTMSYIRTNEDRRVQVQSDGIPKLNRTVEIKSLETAADFVESFKFYTDLHRHFPYHKLKTRWRLEAYGFEPYKAMVDVFDEYFDATIFCENRRGDWLVMIDEPGPHQGKIFVNYHDDGLYHLDLVDEFIGDFVDNSLVDDRNALIEEMPFFHNPPILGGYTTFFNALDLLLVDLSILDNLRNVPEIDLSELM